MSKHALDLVYVHFAKAGGTSVSHALANHYGDRVFWDISHDPCNDAHDVHEPPVIRKPILAVSGHIRADRYVSHPIRVLMTILREPVDKLISAYFFWKELPPSGNPIHERFLREKPSILDVARETAGVAFPAYFSGFDMRDFDFIGFHDRRVEDLTILSKLAGFPVPHETHLNATPPSEERMAVLANPALLADLRSVLKDDIAFYREVRSQRLNPR